MAIVLNRYSRVRYLTKKKRVNRKRKRRRGSKIGFKIYRENDYKKYKMKEINDGRIIYTYILKDKKLGIYKIGKTTRPIKRFKSLCILGRVIPIALVPKDIEKELHSLYKDNRVVHEEFYSNGATEWFKRGGKFDEFIDQIDTGKVIPYITVYRMVELLLKSSALIISDSNTHWEVTQEDLGYYFIGLKILKATGVLKRNDKRIVANENYIKEILIINGKVAVTEDIIDYIDKNFKMYLSTSLKEFKKKIDKDSSIVKKIYLNKANPDSVVYLMINKKED